MQTRRAVHDPFIYDPVPHPGTEIDRSRTRRRGKHEAHQFDRRVSDHLPDGSLQVFWGAQAARLLVLAARQNNL
jgi:hypothetical protein